VSPHAAPALAPLSSPPRAGALLPAHMRPGAAAGWIAPTRYRSVLPQPPPVLGVLGVVFPLWRGVEVRLPRAQIVCNAHERTISPSRRQPTRICGGLFFN
jgi:hypothetical protein